MPWWTKALIGLVAVFAVLQLVPYGRAHDNPKVVQEPAWDRPETREVAVRLCYDCHSNETRWPWYSHVAPVSWLVQHDVDEARRELNFSEWHRPQDEADEAADIVAHGSMPLSYYVWMHPETELDEAERRQFVLGLRATLGDAGEKEGEHDEHGEHEGHD